ncbi:related to Serine/threonine-protein kinase STE11 [Hanseniaspora guilliermondii]|uniref:Related to Serine/threonine-protein kinase STE11 n=1 Tax=Hanseniaspora guilliermondii TaxID=56406 RepID=A0A1L0FE69_9ASCO|nr:related to Serine/threonine-protein kinase STE11 [Hanseniaspora guilliermondii]
MLDEIEHLGSLVNSLNITVDDECMDDLNQISKDKFPFIDKEVLKLLGINKIGDRIKTLNALKNISSAKAPDHNIIDELENSISNTNNKNYQLTDNSTINFILNDGSVNTVNIQNCFTADSIKIQLLKNIDQDKYGYPLDSSQFDVFYLESNTNDLEFKLVLLYDVELVTISHSSDKYMRKRLIFVPKWETPSKSAIWRCKKIMSAISNLENASITNKELIKMMKRYMHSVEERNRDMIRSPLNDLNQRPAQNFISNNLKSYFPKTSQQKLKSTMITSLKQSYQKSLYNPREYNGQHKNLQNIGSIFLNESEKMEKEILKDPDFDKYSTLSRQSLCASLTGIDDDELEEYTEENLDADIRGNWIKGSKLGAGSYGNVFLGLNSKNGTLMAVKQVPYIQDIPEQEPVQNNEGNDEENVTDEEKQKKNNDKKRIGVKMVEALEKEIELLQKLKHENIVEYLGSSNEGGFLNIFLEYVPGGSISQMLSSYGPLEESLVRSFVKQILVGISYLHRKNVIHRDIKGANILIDTQGVVKITDFGISTKLSTKVRNQWMKKNQDEAEDNERKASLQGSVYWMAPEVVKQITITSKADIWSIGCVIIEMCTAKHPFPEYSQMQALFKIGTNVVPKLPTQVEFENERKVHASRYKHNKITDLSNKGRVFLSKCLVLDFQRRPNSIELLNNSWLLEEII